MQHQPQIVGTFDVAGIPCGLTCGEKAFHTFLSSLYTDFASDVSPELSVRVEVTAPPTNAESARWTGPFARIGGRDRLLTIEGAGFRGAFDEESDEGWISQPPDRAPLETFLTAICARRLLRHQGFLLHAAAIMTDKDAYVFFGPSGSGKTTVAELIGEGVITDEIVAIRRDGASYWVSTVPWRGRRLAAPLAGLFRLRQARETSFTRLSPVEIVRQLLPCVFFSRADASEVDRFLGIAAKLVAQVPCYEMHFCPDGSFWNAIPGRPAEEIHGLPLSAVDPRRLAGSYPDQRAV